MENVKLVIWDLDETFWQGTLSDGAVTAIPENIELIKTLTDKGIINSICSKNDFTKTRSELEKFGIWDYFVFPSINWENKGARVKQIIDDMQLRAVNVLFVDDNVNNLREAEFTTPGLQTAMPDKLALLSKTKAFIGKNDKDHSRLKQYKILEKKHIAKQATGDNDEFLRLSEIKVEMLEDNTEHLPRIYEMIHRNNQLNFTKDRITQEEVNQLFTDKSVCSGMVHVTDKYGDHGLIGCYAVKDGRLLQFVFSCRIMGMGVEQYVYAELGFPEIKIVGEVVGELKQDEKPGWINQKSTTTTAATVAPQTTTTLNQTIKRTPKLLIYGDCILRPIHGYVEDELDKSDAIYSAPPLPVTNLAGAWRYNTEQHKEWTNNVANMHPMTYDPRIVDPSVDYLLISLLWEFVYLKYTHNDNSNVCFYTGKISKENTKNIIHKNYTGSQVTEADILNELRYVADHLSGKLVILTLPNYKASNQGEDIEYLKRITLNKIAETLAAEKSNVILLDMRKFMRSQADSLDGTINHYTRETGFKIAMNLLEIMGVRKKKEEIKIAPPANAVKIKSAIAPAKTDDTPEYLAYIRNGVFYIDVDIANSYKYEIKYTCKLNRKTIEETEYGSNFNYKRSLTQTGAYWATVSIREKNVPLKEYKFNSAQVRYTEWITTNYYDAQSLDFDEHIKGQSTFFSQYPDAVNLRRRWTQQLFLLKSHGITIADYFKKKNIQDVSLFSDTELYPLILQSLENVDCRIRYKFTDDWMFDLYPESGFASRHVFHEWAGNYVGPLDTVLIATQDLAFFGGDARARVHAAKAIPLTLDVVLNELITDLVFNKMLPKILIDKEVRNVPIIIFQTPNSQQSLVALSSSDKQVLKFNEATLLEAKKKANQNLPNIYKEIPLEELTETLQRPMSYRLPNGVMSLRDVSGKYLNVTNGRRKTIGQPNNYKGKIYLFGHQGLFGVGVKDADTIGSQLQTLMPEYYIENCSNYWNFLDWENTMLGGLIKSIDFKSGDVICIQCQSKLADKERQTFSFEAIDKPCIAVNCDPLFQQPDQPDLFLLPYSSLAPWGNAKVAELLRDTILKNIESQ
jgi:FkbH-like protein